MKTKILLADDERSMEDLFAQVFRRQISAGTYEFVFAYDGQQALTLLEQQPDIDLVLSDINMPGMDGLTLLDKLPDVNPLLRAVIITAYGDMNNIRTAMNRGAFDFITKPVNFKDLEVTIEKTIRQVHQLRETAELRAVDEMKTRFFTNITHEFRTPLSLIVSPVDKLLDTNELPAPHLQLLNTVRRNARQLLRLINQLLDINKLEARQMDLVEEVGDLPAFVGQLVDLFRPSTDIKQLTLTYSTDLPSGAYVFDAGKWEKIVYNLLSNAIKFTETGSINVSLDKLPYGVRLSVRDTGIGIPADKLPHIFNRFYQVDNARTRTYEGSGIGLTLVHELVSRMDGTVTVESYTESPQGQSRPDQSGPGLDWPGTCFQLELPVKFTEQFANVPVLPQLQVDLAVPVSMGAPGNGVEAEETVPLILIVEDNAELREFIVTELATTYRVRSATNGYEGWMLAKEELPDVVISDLMMPRMDGYGLVDHLKADPVTAHIAVLLLTADVQPESRLQGFSHGADEYLTKPFHLGELRLRLRNMLNRQQKLRDYYRQQLTQPDDAQPPVETVQDQFLRKFYALLDERLDDATLNVDWLAEQMAVSRKTLYLKLHNLTHLSTTELVRQYRLGKAIQLLRQGHNISETAYMVGFESPSYFTKVFREVYNQTPTEYVKS